MTAAIMPSTAARRASGGASTRRRISINESVVCAELEGEAILLNVDTGIYFGLDAVGARIWSLLIEGTTDDEIADCLTAEYEVEPARVRSDLADFLHCLTAKGLARAAAQ